MIIEPVYILSNSNLYIKKCNRERHLAYLDVICLINNILKGVDAGIEVDTTSTPFCVRSFVRNLSILMKQLFRNMP